jgi:acetoacetyl-CoA synthetase
VSPSAEVDLSALTSVGSTGAPLPTEGFEWFYEHVREDIPLASSSGVTDICGIFVGHAPTVSVWAGEISCRVLVIDVAAFDRGGRPVVGSQGEPVVTQPLPSMPIVFSGDHDGSRYRRTYFERFPGSWRRGDWVVFAERGPRVIGGRSDATLNRGGVCLGTAERYEAVESTGDVTDSVIAHRQDHADGRDELIMFVVLAPGHQLDDAMRNAIRRCIREHLSPRHIPDRIVVVPVVQRTLTGKKLEVSVKRILAGEPVHRVVSIESLADPGVLLFYERRPASTMARSSRVPAAPVVVPTSARPGRCSPKARLTGSARRQ